MYMFIHSPHLLSLLFSHSLSLPPFSLPPSLSLSLPPKDAILSLIRTLPYCSHQEISEQTIEDFAFHILNESCTTVTNTAAKTAVQLVFGKANLVSL